MGDSTKAPKAFSAYAANKCIIGYGLINGIINAAIFAGIHASQPGATFEIPDIVMDLALTGLLLGIILFACVVPLTRMDLKAGRFAAPEELPSIEKILPGAYVGTMFLLGLIASIVAVVLGVALTLLIGLALPLPLSFTAMMILKGCICASIGGISGYLTITYVVRDWSKREED